MTDVIYDVTVDNTVYLGCTALEAIELRQRYPYATVKARRLKARDERPTPPKGAA